MRFLSISSSLIFLLSGLSHAQGWIKYIDESERFMVNFPGEPVVQSTEYRTEGGVLLPARVYTVESPPSRFSITVVDYTQAVRVHRERCESPSYECAGFTPGDDVRGAIAFAAWNARKRNDGEVTYDAYGQVDGIPGHQLQIVHSDGSRTFMGIYLHARRLYILEGSVPEEDPPPGLFQQSLGILDEEGRRVRYRYNANDERYRVDVSYEWIGVEDPDTGEPQPVE